MPAPRPVRRTGVNVAVSLIGQLVGKASTLAWTLVAARELTASTRIGTVTAPPSPSGAGGKPRCRAWRPG